ncbi:hypothetical protein AWW72_03550 [Acinetobacter sp. NRRL B-65365]|nr:hypothetical protein AWW72_03550 [Acinetobacter sp. NRRL B-65365]
MSINASNAQNLLLKDREVLKLLQELNVGFSLFTVWIEDYFGMCLTSWLFLQHLYGELRFCVWVNILMFLATRSLATRLLAELESFLRTKLRFVFSLFTHSLAVRLALGQSFTLFFPLYSQHSCSSCAQTKLCFVNLGSGMKIAMFSPENGLISCHGTIKLRPA